MAYFFNSRLYDREGTDLGNFPLFNLTTNTGFMVKDNYMEEFTQGQFRQASGKIGDNIVDYDVRRLIDNVTVEIKRIMNIL